MPIPETKPASSSPLPTTPSTAVTPDPGAPPIKRRAPIACRRCRRMRSKCIHDKAAPPCKSCREANVSEECVFPTRGDSDQDRSFRHPRRRADKKAKTTTTTEVKVKKELPITTTTTAHLIRGGPSDFFKPPKLENDWTLLPSVDVVVDGINTFTRNYYQLGFIPKKRFPRQVRDNPSSMSAFLLLSILAISARFDGTLRGGDGLDAAAEFMRKAQFLAVHELYQQPTLERCQAFYLLSIAEQGCGKSNTSYISAGIAFRMAALMRLHREEAYSPITSQSPVEHRVRAESARRTFWMLHSQDNLSSGPYKPLSLAPNDITALLPSSEAEFEAGSVPERRSALEGTPPAIQDPSLTSLNPRSLFASLMQVHNLWGIVARRVLFNKKRGRPNDGGSEYGKLNRRLLEFERNLPNEHTFNVLLLRGYESFAEDLSYLGLTGCMRLCHIVLRKEYMEEMIRFAEGNPSNPEVRFYKDMAAELFFNVRKLYSQIEAHYDEGFGIDKIGSQMAGFIIYGCGLLASYLCKFPQLDAHHAGQNLETIQAEGRKMYTHIVTVLRGCQKAWPLAETWCNGLEKWYEDSNPKRISFQAGTMTDGKEPQPYALSVMHPRTTTSGVQSEALDFNRVRSTPPTTAAAHTEEHQQQQQHAIAAAGYQEPPQHHRLAPLQQTKATGTAGYAPLQPVCLPPLSQQAPAYGTATATASTSTSTHRQQQLLNVAPHSHPPPYPLLSPSSPFPHHQHHHQQQHNHNQHHNSYYPTTPLDLTIASSAHHPHAYHQPHPTTTPTPTPTPYYTPSPSTANPHIGEDQGVEEVDDDLPPALQASLNDGFDSNLQMLVDGAGAQWTAATGTDEAGGGAGAGGGGVVMYAAYEIPSYLPQG